MREWTAQYSVRGHGQDAIQPQERAGILRGTPLRRRLLRRRPARGRGMDWAWARQRLGLAGKVRADDFLRLCENQHPATGETLTQRLNTTRTEGGENAANRRIFYDFTFSPPKSVSLAGFLGKDERILEAHARAVQSALREFEAFAATRIRVGGAQSDRRTGQLCRRPVHARHVARPRSAPAHALHRLQRDVRRGGESLEGASELRTAARQEVRRECLLPRTRPRVAGLRLSHSQPAAWRFSS